VRLPVGPQVQALLRQVSRASIRARSVKTQCCVFACLRACACTSSLRRFSASPPSPGASR
jgi:hypothetical protein